MQSRGQFVSPPFAVTLAASLVLAGLAGCSSSGAKADAADRDGGIDSPGSGNDAVEGGSAPDAAATFTNMGVVDFTGTGDVVITSQSAELATATGTISGATSADTAYRFMEVEQGGGAPRLAVFVARSFRIEPSALLRIDGPNPVALVALNDIQIFGTLSGSGQGDKATAGGSACTTTGKGGGAGGGGPRNSYSGGGGGSFCGLGGTGNAAAGIPGGVGGPAYGTPTLVPLLGGSSGGGEATFAGGGAGGGAIQLAAGRSVIVGIAGIVEVGGGGGDGNGCGGGSGGAILLEAPTVTMAGILAANGGSGAANTGGPYGQDGQPGWTPATGVPTAGVGSGASMINGGPGSITGTSVNSSGSGGGGAGRIRINSREGAVSGIISPDATTTCFSQGTI